jgi:DNA-binding transcriptional regulator YiaG
MAKASLTPLESLQSQLRKRFSKAAITLDRPRKRSGVWYLDVSQDGHPVIIQWQEGSGFGVTSSAKHAYGEGADEVYQDQEAAYGRVVSLLLSRKFTAPPEPVQLRELRKELGLSQQELAGLLNKQQGEVSKIERRYDVLVSTLREVLQSMGAKLEIGARFANGDLRPLEICENPPKAAVKKSATAGRAVREA